MDTLQINELCLNRYYNFLGCIDIDELKDKKIRNQLYHDFNMGKVIIFNIDNSSDSGRHWVLLHRMIGGKLWFFDAFGAFGNDSVFQFDDFGDVEKSMTTSYDDILDGQFFQYSTDFNYKEDFAFKNNIINTLLLDKNLLKLYTNYDNMSVYAFILFARFSERVMSQ